MVKRRFLSTRILESGMIIDQSIIDRTGRILVARKTVLDDYIIDALQKMKITGVYIREGEEEFTDTDIEASPEALQKIEQLKKQDCAKVQLTESVKKRVAEGMHYMFNNPRSEGFMDTANDIAGELMKAITENDAIAVNVDALKVCDEYTFKHSVDVASISMIIAKQCNMPEKTIYQIGVAGLLHDIGKAEIPNEILNKPARLTEEEFGIMKKHPVLSYNMLKDKPDITQEVLMGVLQHHEKIDGSGYPLGLDAQRICSYAKIIAVADIYDALVTERPYKKGLSPRDAVEMIMAMTEELEADVIKVFLNSVILYPVESLVQLSNGETAKVVENNAGYPTRPKVVGISTGKVYDLAGDVACASIIVE